MYTRLFFICFSFLLIFSSCESKSWYIKYFTTPNKISFDISNTEILINQESVEMEEVEERILELTDELSLNYEEIVVFLFVDSNTKVGKVIQIKKMLIHPSMKEIIIVTKNQSE